MLQNLFPNTGVQNLSLWITLGIIAAVCVILLVVLLLLKKKAEK